MLRRFFATLCLALVMTLASVPLWAQSAQEGAPAAVNDDATAAISPWQAYVRRVAGEYELTAAGREVQLLPEPLLKWSQPIRGGESGALFLWIERQRPAVIATFFVWPYGDGRDGVAHELHTLSSDAVEGNWRQSISWRPNQDAVRWQDVPGSPPAAETQTRRLIEARQLARRFTASSKTPDGVTNELRLQPRPFFTYESPDPETGWLGGALFSFAEGTDTEVVLWLEAVKKPSPMWRHALVRMSDLELSVRIDGVEAWTVPFAEYDDYRAAYLCTTPEFFSEPP